MADTKASAEPAASPLSPSDGWAGVQSGLDVFITVDQVKTAVASGRVGIPTVSRVGDGSTSISTSSTSFTDIANFSPLSIPAAIGDIIEIEFSAGPFASGGAGYAVFVGFDINGTFVPAAAMTLGTSGQESNLVVRRRRTVLSGDLVSGSVPIKPQWKVDAGTVGLENSANVVPLFTLKNFGDGVGAYETHPKSTWSKTDKHAQIQITNKFLLTGNSSAGDFYKTARATLGLEASTSVAYFELSAEPSNQSPFYAIYGVADAAMPTNDYTGQTATSYGYQGSSGNKCNNAVFNPGFNFSGSGTNVGILIKNGDLYFKVNGVWQDGSNPATDTNPAYSGLSGLIYPAISLYNARDAFRAYFKASDQLYNDGWPAWDQN